MKVSKFSARTCAWMLAVLIGAALAGPVAARADNLKDGRNALQAGRLDDAIKSFEKAAQEGLAAGRAGVGQVWLRRRQLDKAMEAFQQAQKMDDKLPMAYFGQAEVLRAQSKCAEALPLYQRATQLDAKFPEAQLGLGDCLLQTKQYDKAVAAFNEGLKWGPKWQPRFLVALGTAEMSRDSLRSAGIYFTRAREQAPGDPAVRKATGDFYLQRGTWALAILEYKAAVDLDTNDVELRYALGQALYYDKRYNEALEEFGRVTAKDPDFAPAQLALGNLLYLAGNNGKEMYRYEQAKAPLERYVQLEPNDGKGWSLLGRNYYYLKQGDKAFEAMDKAEKMGAANKEMYTIMGRAYADKKDWDKALEFFAKGEPTARDQLQIGQMMVFKYKANSPDSIWLARADSIYQTVIDHDPTTSDARFAMVELAKNSFRRKDYPTAIERLERRNKLDPPSGEAYYYYSLSLKEMNPPRWPEALAAMQRAAAIDSARGDRYFWLGVLLDHDKRTDEARQAFERSLAFDSTSTLAGKADRQLGFYRLLDKDWSGAIRLLDKAVQLDSKDVQAWVWLGQGYQNSGNRQKAIECYRKALELDPKQPEALKGIQVLTAPVTTKGASK